MESLSRSRESAFNVAALIVAAGRGQRVGGDTPKQYQRLAGKPVLHHTLKALGDHPKIDVMRVAIHPDDAPLYGQAIDGLPPAVMAKLLPPVPGGARRQDSVRLGLESLAGHAPRRVLIHDGARPLLAPAIIERTIAALDRADGAIAAVRVSDTLKREGAERRIAETIERAGLWRAQTPQGFRFAAILAAHHAASSGPELTDDAAVAERAGLNVVLVEGSEANLKITTPEDFRRAESMLGEAPRAESSAPVVEPRTATGFDVHRFGPGDHVMICGVRVPHDAGVVAHSDGDVGLHALVDALLGALGAGDIGSHFPPSDPQWRHVDSALFVRHALGLVRARGATISHVDITVLCERPKIGPHRVAMVARLSDLLGIDSERVSVKATTTEQLGFTGRREGLAAQAIATLLVPARRPSA
jgi:2-C-methyl-D-erythritol 4-phosphate cytidylyltransferase/2-C-methyl-D-erythritol 2,4-cyclodiphosphate synthase